MHGVLLRVRWLQVSGLLLLLLRLLTILSWTVLLGMCWPAATLLAAVVILAFWCRAGTWIVCLLVRALQST